MGDFHEIRKIMTAKEIAKSEGVTVRAINERWKANFHEIQFDCNAPLSPEQVEALSRKKPARAAKQAKAAPRKAPMLSPEQQPATVHQPPAPADEPAPMPPGRAKFAWPEWPAVRRFLFETLAVCIVIGHGYMIWQEAAEIYGYIGNIGGAVIFAIVCLAVLIAADSSRNRTSWFALLFMVFVDFAAGFVHYEALRTPVVPEAMTIGFCIFICASSFVALLLFRDSKLD